MTIPLDFLRTLQTAYLPDTCTIQRATVTETGDGRTMTWANLVTGVACRVSPLASGAQEALGSSGAITAEAQWVIWLPALQDVTVKDRIVYGSRTFEVARVGARSYETVRECLCRELT